jgi:hypothetical protein
MTEERSRSPSEERPKKSATAHISAGSRAVVSFAVRGAAALPAIGGEGAKGPVAELLAGLIDVTAMRATTPTMREGGPLAAMGAGIVYPVERFSI